MNAAQKRVAALDAERTIHVVDGRGLTSSYAEAGTDLALGKASLKLLPGEGLTKLKGLIKGQFDKLPKFKVRERMTV